MCTVGFTMIVASDRRPREPVCSQSNGLSATFSGRLPAARSTKLRDEAGNKRGWLDSSRKVPGFVEGKTGVLYCTRSGRLRHVTKLFSEAAGSVRKAKPTAGIQQSGQGVFVHRSEMPQGRQISTTKKIVGKMRDKCLERQRAPLNGIQTTKSGHPESSGTATCGPRV